jgi:hypothetical protein
VRDLEEPGAVFLRELAIPLRDIQSNAIASALEMVTSRSFLI